MQTEILISGFGGQGILFAGQLLAYAAMDGGKEVTWIPSYGPEMRGGTANCTVIIADEDIGSPTVRNPQAVLAFNLPSLEKYESLITKGGVMVANASLVNRTITRMDLRAVLLPANEIAESIGEKRLTNMVMVGALLGILPVLSLESLQKALQEHLPSRHQRLLPLNYQALQAGLKYAQQGV
jgi:2-oxoglutarate ferredoxin oxidoreductase subunit gamma